MPHSSRFPPSSLVSAFQFPLLTLPFFLPNFLTLEYPRAQSLDLSFIYIHSSSDLIWSHRYTSLSISLFLQPGPSLHVHCVENRLLEVRFQEEADYETTVVLVAAEKTRRNCFLNFEGRNNRIY